MKTIFTVVFVILLKPYLTHQQCTSFANTEYRTQGTDCGSRCVDLNVKKPLCEVFYTSGCFCRTGFYRDTTWNCVIPDKCLEVKTRNNILENLSIGPGHEPEEDCPANEFYSECGNYCSERCRNSNDNNCPENTCDSGCFCVDGYFRKDNGQCVPQSKCGVKYKNKNKDLQMSCPYNEIYDKCGDRCQEICPHLSHGCQGGCAKGCFCIEGYGRNVEGDCVPLKKCKKAGKCYKNEYFDMCGNPCIEKCSPRLECPKKCKPGCYCIKGYLRNDELDCVSEKSSSCQVRRRRKQVKLRPEDCDTTEIPMKCGSRCGESCESLEKEYVCPKKKVCEVGCFCDEGLYRNKKGKCVTADKCSKSSPEIERKRRKLKKACDDETEEFSECGNHCPSLCRPPQVCPTICEFGCFCKPGLFRHPNGLCVQEKNCPALAKPAPVPLSLPECGFGEKYFDTCKKDCLEYCHEVKEKSICPQRKKCRKGCLCQKGYYRDNTDKCVPLKYCPHSDLKSKNKKKVKIPDCDDNEEFLTCGNYCIELCKPPKKCPKKCQSGCFCQRNFYRNNKGKCVREKKCRPKMSRDWVKLRSKDKCGKNSIFKECGNSCGETCKEQAKHIICPKRFKCEAGCFCKPNHFKDSSGQCVPINECKPKVGKFRPTTTTAKPKKKKCKKNEQYDECGDHCIEACTPPDSCDTSCEPGCFCEVGFYRKSPDGPCVEEDECPKKEKSTKIKLKIKLKCEENEIYSECGTRCGQLCIDLFKTTICPKKGLCVGGCFCKPGYFRNTKGKCVTQSQCPDSRKITKPIECDENEEFNTCGQRCEQSCETYLHKKECPERKCTSGCFCKKGFYKDPYGNCVEPNDCTDPLFPKVSPETCDKKEEHLTCGNRCGQTCEELTQNVTCSDMRSCISGCFCKKGNRRNNKGVCVPEEDCYNIKTKINNDINCDKNEEYSRCEVRCGQACEDIGRKVDCPKSRQCASGCFCKEGLFRNEMGNCVPENECPDVGPPNIVIQPKLDCGPNEDYNECGTRCGQGCEDLGRKTPCSKRRICVSGCFCKEGFFRNMAGECVPMIECPNISPPQRPRPSCDPNEEFNECGKRCGQSCDDFINKKKCSKNSICVIGCFCDIDGHYRRDHKGDCVKQDTCPAKGEESDNRIPIDSVKCGRNEEYNDCGTRCGQGCEDQIYGSECPKTKVCVSGCFCLDGFLRNEIGECVPQKECPPLHSNKTNDCGDNEKYTDCGSHCGQSCDDVANPKPCPRKRMCIPGCFCKSGFYRDKYDNCVTPKGCSAKTPPTKKVKNFNMVYKTTTTTEETSEASEASEATEGTESSTEEPTTTEEHETEETTTKRERESRRGNTDEDEDTPKDDSTKKGSNKKTTKSSSGSSATTTSEGSSDNTSTEGSSDTTSTEGSSDMTTTENSSK